jgi:hypothetical protein
LGLMFSLKPAEPTFYNAFGFYRLAGEGWRGTPCHGDLGGSRRTQYQYPAEDGDWIRIERRDKLFRAYRSLDGKKWGLTRQLLINQRSSYNFSKGVVGVTFRQQPAGAGAAWAQGAMDHIVLEKGTFESAPTRIPVKREDANMFDGRVIAVVQSTSAPKTMYARTSGRGILKSLDGGNTWKAANGNLKSTETRYVRSIAVHPKNEKIVLAGVGRMKEGRFHGGLYKTTDGGASWRQVSDQVDFDGAGPSTLLGEVIAFNTHRPEVIAAGGESKGLFLSPDSGKTWQKVDVAKPLRSVSHRISSLHYNSFLDGHWTVGTFPDAEFKALGLGAPGLSIPEQKGGGLYRVGGRVDKKTGKPEIRWESEPYPGFGYSDVFVTENKIGGSGYFMTSRGAFKRNRDGMIHSLPNIPQDSFYSQFGLGGKTRKEQIRITAPFSSDDSNPVTIFFGGKLSRSASSPVPLNAGISGIHCDVTNPKITLFVCNRHGILKSDDRGKSYKLVYKASQGAGR